MHWNDEKRKAKREFSVKVLSEEHGSILIELGTRSVCS